MDHDVDHGDASRARSPLIPIGLVVLGTLLVPILLYSTGPEGPIKAGDIVFSTGAHRVYLSELQPHDGRESQPYCILEPQEQLLTMQPPSARADGTFIARKIGDEEPEQPYCPSNVDLIVKAHQVSLKASVLSGLGQTLSHVLGKE